MSLTPRQLAILQLTADGHTYAAIGRIADQLGYDIALLPRAERTTP